MSQVAPSIAVTAPHVLQFTFLISLKTFSKKIIEKNMKKIEGFHIH